MFLGASLEASGIKSGRFLTSCDLHRGEEHDLIDRFRLSPKQTVIHSMNSLKFFHLNFFHFFFIGIFFGNCPLFWFFKNRLTLGCTERATDGVSWPLFWFFFLSKSDTFWSKMLRSVSYFQINPRSFQYWQISRSLFRSLNSYFSSDLCLSKR